MSCTETMRQWILLFLYIRMIAVIAVDLKQHTGKSEKRYSRLHPNPRKLTKLTESPLIEWTVFEKSNKDLKHGNVITKPTENYHTTTSHQTRYIQDIGYTKEDLINKPTNSLKERDSKKESDNELTEHNSLSDRPALMEPEVPRIDSVLNEDTSSQSLPSSFNPIVDDCVYDVFESAGDIVFPTGVDIPRTSVSEMIMCKWRIRVPVGPNIKLSFKKLDLELGSEYLQLAVGMGGNKQTRYITGTKIPEDLTVEGSELWLTLRSHGRGGYTQVSIIFFETVQDPKFPYRGNSSCGGTETDLQGNITSPGYPVDNYNNNEECTWFISAPANAVIQVSVVDFHTEMYDQVRLGVGLLSKAPATRLLTLFGQLESEREAIIPANSLWINFYADDTISDKGFLIQYQIILREVCNSSHVYKGDKGEMTSVNYPLVYPINSECTWLIRGPIKTWINFTLYDLDIQDGRDFLLIGEGNEVFGGPFTTYSGNISEVANQTVESSEAWIHFTSDHMSGHHFRGFRLTYTAWEIMEQEVTDIQNTTTLVVVQDKKHDDSAHLRSITLRLTNVTQHQFAQREDVFRIKLASMLSVLCSLKFSCNGLEALRAEDVQVAWSREENKQLVVEVRLLALLDREHAMDAVDYEDLEKLFHTDLQTLDLQNRPGEAGVEESSNLPEWLIGVIVVVILLVGVFFAMVIYSLIKERRKTRAGSYGANQSSTSMCQETEVGKDDGNIRITSFIVDNEKGSGNGWIDTEAATLQRRPQTGIQGCMNPAFVDEDENGKKTEKTESKRKEKEEKGENASTDCSNSKTLDSVNSKEQDKVHEAADSNNSKSTEGSVKSDGAVKSEDPTPSTSGIDDNKPHNDDNDCNHSRNSSTDSNHSDKGNHSDLSTNL